MTRSSTNRICATPRTLHKRTVTSTPHASALNPYITPPARLPFPRGGEPGARSSGGAHWLHAGPAPAFTIPTGRARRVPVRGDKNPCTEPRYAALPAGPQKLAGIASRGCFHWQ